MNISNYTNNSPIAFFDSGLGGLTVLDQVRKILPDESYIYFGDTLHVPYGTKSKEQLLEYSKDILAFFAQKKCKALVMACNTTSSLIYEEIKDSCNFKIYPIIQSVAKIISEYDIERIGLFATKGTVNSNAYPREIHRYNPNMKLFAKACPNWVEFVEDNKIDTPVAIDTIRSDLSEMMKNNPQKIILGCTHYPFLLKILSRFVDADSFINPAISFADFIKSDLESSNLLANSSEKSTQYFVSANPESFNKSVKSIFDINIDAQLISF